MKPLPAHPADTIDSAVESVPVPSQLQRYWRISSVAKMLDFSRQAIYQAVRNGTLPATKVFSEHDKDARGSLRIKEADLLEYLARCEARGIGR